MPRYGFHLLPPLRGGIHTASSTPDPAKASNIIGFTTYQSKPSSPHPNLGMASFRTPKLSHMTRVNYKDCCSA